MSVSVTKLNRAARSRNNPRLKPSLPITTKKLQLCPEIVGFSSDKQGYVKYN